MEKMGYNFWIILLVIIVAIFGVYIFSNKLNVEGDQDNISQESKIEAIKEKEREIIEAAEEKSKQCQDELKIASSEQIIEEMNDKTSGVPVYVFARLMDYLKCKIHKNYELGKFTSINDLAHIINFENVKFLTIGDLVEGDLDRLKDVAKRLSYPSYDIENNEQFFEEYQKDELNRYKRLVEINLRIPIYDLVKSDLGIICPNDQENPEILEWIVKYFSRANKDFKNDILSNLNGYCSEIRSYSDEDELNRKIYNFESWAKNVDLRAFEIEWKTLLAYRFGGREKSEGVCSNNLGRDSEPCLGVVERYNLLIKTVNNYSNNCQDEWGELVGGICQFQL